MAHLIGGAKPPPQVLHGSRVIRIDITPDTSQQLLTQKLKRRARKISTAGVIRSRVELVTYEVFACGAVMRIDEGGEAKRVPEGHPEWQWTRAALDAVHARLKRGQRDAPLPPGFAGYDRGPAISRKTGD